MNWWDELLPRFDVSATAVHKWARQHRCLVEVLNPLNKLHKYVHLKQPSSPSSTCLNRTKESSAASPTVS